jgi:membrane fusion protein (multidrug efflux system)
VPGIIETVDFTEGQAVEKGDVLFHLRDRQEAARLREAEAELALAREDFERTTALESRNAAAAAQVDKVRANLEMARARADLRRVELDRMQIRAPFAGRLGARLVSPGARIKADDGLVRLDAMDPLALVFTIPESVLPLARIGAEFELEVAAFPGRRWPGAIRFIAPNVDSASRRVLIKGHVPNPDGTLLPGMFARVQATLGERDALVIPEEALVTDPDGAFVWRIGAEDKAERVTIEIGTREPGRVEVRAGLAEGDRIVVAGTHKVRAGVAVKPMPAVVGGARPAAPSAAVSPGGGA